MAGALAEGAREQGAEVRLRRVAEIAPERAIAANPRWSEHRELAASVEEAHVEDMAWAEAFAFGTPTRFGAPSAQRKQFIDQRGGLWAQGKLADKLGTSFTTASTGHGGLESTILALKNVLYHWGARVMPLGYAGEKVRGLGNPYGASWVSREGAAADDLSLQTCRDQGRRLVRLGSALATRPRGADTSA